MVGQTNGQASKTNVSFSDKSQQARQDMFVTGVVGRSMGSGHFSVDEIDKLTQNAVKAFNEYMTK